MSEEFTIQCQSCGTYYNDLQEVCPYCGEPQPGLTEEIPPEQADYPEEPLLEAQLPEDEVITALDETPVLDQYPEEGQFPEDEEALADTPFVDDDIFAIAGDAAEEAMLEDDYEHHYEDEYGAFPDQIEDYEEYHDDINSGQIEGNTLQNLFTWRRMITGCLGMLLCLGLLFGGIGLMAVRRGLEERALIAQSESQAHFQKGQEHLANNSMELAIAEFEQALKLDPNFSEARQALREAQRIAQNQPTPTSETRSAAASDLFSRAETQIDEQNWAEAVKTLSQVRDLDPDYEAEDVSEMLYTANYRLGLQLITPNLLEEALAAFENALAERPGDSEALAEQAKASLYLDGLALEDSDPEAAVKVFHQLFQQDGAYLDIKQRLWRAYERYGDELAEVREWCQAEVQYIEAHTLQASTALQGKVTNSNTRCQDTSTIVSSTPQTITRPTVTADTGATNAAQPTPTMTTTNLAGPVTPPGGSIIFSAFNPNEARWEIVSVPVRGGPPEVLATEATMPAVSPNGQLLLYHTELVDTEGLHILDLTTGEDRRVTNVRDHILPRWSDNTRFIFTAQEAATGRWQVHQGFADGKSEPIIIRDGRTPDWSATGSTTIAYQGTDPAGNDPGIYLVPFGGGEPTRLTSHESDRSPAFSADGSQLAYMSTRSGNWDIYTVSAAGSAPRQITTATGNDGLPAWSPDDSQIAYVSDADGSWAIYTISATGGTPTKVTEWDGANRADWLMAQIWWAR